MRHRNLASLLCGLCLVAPGAQAGDPGSDLALQLIRAMKVDEQAAMKVHNLAASRWRSGNITEQQRDCALKVSQTDFTDMLMHFARRELTPAEMQAAIEYFKSTTGMKHIEVMRAEQGLAATSFFKQDPDDQAKMLAFLETPAGYRLITRGLLTTSTEASNYVDRRRRSVTRDCGR